MLVKFIRPKECVKEDPALPVEDRFYGARQNQQCEEKLPEETTTASNQAVPLHMELFASSKLIFLNPQFFRPFPKLYKRGNLQKSAMRFPVA